MKFKCFKKMLALKRLRNEMRDVSMGWYQADVHGAKKDVIKRFRNHMVALHKAYDKIHDL